MSGPFYEPCHCPHGVRWGLILMGQLEILIGKVFNYQDYYIYKDSVADLIITLFTIVLILMSKIVNFAPDNELN